MDDTDVGGPRQLKHQQVREYVRSVCVGAEPGTPAPSERELVTRFGVARMTVRQAIDSLVAEGIVERVRGRGTFVTRPRRRIGQLTSLTEELHRRKMTLESRTLSARREAASPRVARALGLTVGDPVIRWRRLRSADGSPLAIQDAYLNEVLLPGFLIGGGPDSLWEELARRGLRPTWAEDSVTADVAAEDEADLLEVEPRSAVLRITRRALAHERPIEVSRSVFRGDRYTMWLQLGEGD